MADTESEGIRIREAHEVDAAGVAAVYRAVYGDTYMHPRFYDVREIMRMAFDENTLVLIAEDTVSGRIVGSASVLYEMGAYTDLVGEFGRLAVHPEWRGRGIGTRLMSERLRRVGERLHVGFAEVRVVNPYSPSISQRHGFVPVGALPQKFRFGDHREHGALLVRYFGDALALRRNHPRIIPEAHHLAEVALSGAGLDPDAIVDDEAAAYPRGATYDVEDLTSQGYASLLRIERGRVQDREVFGPQRLQYGLFKLAASHAHYIVARSGERIVGALGYILDEIDGIVRVFELINTEEDVVRFLLEELGERCRGLAAAEVDVSAHAPRLQRTLLELGYLPAAYVPAMVFDEVERVDVVKMYRLMDPLQDLPFEAPEPTLSLGRYVLERFAAHQLLPRLARVAERLDLCAGLTDEQTTQLLGEFRSGVVERGSELFAQGATADRMILVLAGTARVLVDGTPVGSVGSREALGEVAFLNASSHSATAVAETDMEIGTLTREALDTLVRRRPDIGAVVYRNLARGLGEKLRRSDRRTTDEALDLG